MTAHDDLRDALPPLRAAVTDLLAGLARHRGLTRDKAEAEIAYLEAVANGRRAWEEGATMDAAAEAYRLVDAEVARVQQRVTDARDRAIAAHNAS